ncbi:hypothetical protein ACH0B6_18340 [Solibacillus silvestris]
MNIIGIEEMATKADVSKTAIHRYRDEWRIYLPSFAPKENNRITFNSEEQQIILLTAKWVIQLNNISEAVRYVLEKQNIDKEAYSRRDLSKSERENYAEIIQKQRELIDALMKSLI